MLPLFHDLEGEGVLVFGGGSVGARKARRFDREAAVTVVAPDFVDEDFGAARLVRAEPDPDEVTTWIDDYDPALVVAATDDPRVNEAVADAARERGILCNRADVAGNREPGSVVVPATARDDPVVVAIATGGTAPVLSGYLREQVETLIEGAGPMADLLAQLRDEIADGEIPVRHRRQALRAVVESSDVKRALADGDEKRAAHAAREILKGFA